jgi:mannonate dehydratase
MMDEPGYEGLLFGEISAITFYNRLGEPLKKILERQDLHHRIINGSDYPLPGVNFLLRTSTLAGEGYITEEEAEWLNEIYGFNPLLFDFVVKRTLRHPETGEKLSPSVFMMPEALVTSGTRPRLPAR